MVLLADSIFIATRMLPRTVSLGLCLLGLNRETKPDTNCQLEKEDSLLQKFTTSQELCKQGELPPIIFCDF